jgi:hypothetical protein
MFSGDCVGERYCWVDVGAGNPAEQKDDKSNRRSKCESDDEESLDRSNALSERESCNGPGSDKDEKVGSKKL